LFKLGLDYVKIGQLLGVTDKTAKKAALVSLTPQSDFLTIFRYSIQANEGTLMDVLEYLKSLPQKRMGAGLLLLNASNQILIVKPTYKNHLEIPGGVVELEESPLSAALRELGEETRLSLKSKNVKLVGTDYLDSNEERTEALMFVFLGGILPSNTIHNIKLASDELSEYRFASVDEAERLLGTIVGPRIVRCHAAALKQEFCVYFEDHSL
jgi:ADP-ribose pyrophosphatase YjhB (NUDIX family)